MKPASQPVIFAELQSTAASTRRETAIRMAVAMLEADTSFEITPSSLASLAINHADALLDELDRRDRIDQAEADLTPRSPS